MCADWALDCEVGTQLEEIPKTSTRPPMTVAVDVSPKLPFKRPSSPLLIGTHPTVFSAISDP